MIYQPSGCAEKPRRMAFVDKHQRIVAIGQVTDLGQRRHVAVHREHAIGDDHFDPSRRRLELGLKI